LWKSGALASRQSANKVKGFSPSVPRGLKAFDPREAYAALKGLLFHELARAGNIAANGILVCLILSFVAHAQVTFERLVNSAKEPQNWMTYSGSYSGQRFSKLDKINTGNAPSIVAKWVYQTARLGSLRPPAGRGWDSLRRHG
jgi:glucose dehydrogenase